MKKVLLFLLLIIPVVAMAQAPVAPPTKHTNKPKQSTIKPELKKYVAEMNALCPVDCGTVTATKYTTEGNNAIIVYSVDENAVPINDFQSRLANVKESLLSVYRYDKSQKQFVHYLSESKAGLVILYIGNKSHKQCKITISSTEIADAAKVKDKDKNPLQLLMIYVENMNEQLPAMIDNGVMNTRVVIEDFYVVYEYVCDEDIVSIAQCNEDKIERKLNLIEAIKTVDSQTKTEFMAIALSKRGVAYRYTGQTSGEVCEIRINATELNNALKSNK